MAKVQKINFENFEWTNITNPTEKEMNDLRVQYDFHPLDLADCLSVSHRSKIDVYDEYMFLVFIFPIFNRKTREIESTELNFFISNDYIITVQHGNLAVFNEYFNLFAISPDLRKKYPDRSPEKVAYEVLNKIFLSVLPMVDHVNDDCDNIEKAIFSGKERKMISEILVIRRNITDLRKIMQVHKNVLKKAILNFKESPLFVMKKTDVYFESILDYTKEIWDTLENLKERIEALQQTNESQISFRMSDIMRILTIISFMTFPVTLLATVFGMNTVQAMPFVSNPHGFWYVIGLMLAIVALMLLVFRKKDWI